MAAGSLKQYPNSLKVLKNAIQYLLGQTMTRDFWGVIPFIKLQNDT